ncbi:MAG: hypothetical protein K2X32_10670 [Phycisphaerales bacterium]|nr:hypothetical protein [Phycisphaerales bacterium]
MTTRKRPRKSPPRESAAKATKQQSSKAAKQQNSKSIQTTRGTDNAANPCLQFELCCFADLLL